MQGLLRVCSFDELNVSIVPFILSTSQLKSCLQLGDKNKFYFVILVLILASILLQVIVGTLFIVVGYINFNDTNKQKRLNYMNNIATILVFIITVINVFIAGFGIGSDATTTVI